MSVPAGTLHWADPVPIWRVGYEPDPWGWTPWRYAKGGVFSGRFDDPHAAKHPNERYRVLYAALSATAALVELLAPLRKDPRMAAGLAAIRGVGAGAPGPPGVVDADWRRGKLLGQAQIVGDFWWVTSAEALVQLKTTHHGYALAAGALGVDAAALKDGRYRSLTQSISSTARRAFSGVTGLHYLSRHGDDLALLAIFERGPEPTPGPIAVSGRTSEPLTAAHPDLVRAADLLGLTITP